MIALFLLLAGRAGAGDLETWDAVGDAELLETNGDYDGAIRIYEGLARTLTDEDPGRAEALFRLGNLYQRLGRVEDAAGAFEACVRTRSWRARCLDARGELELEKSAVTTLPLRWTFDDTHHGLLHPWSFESGTIRIDTPAEDGDPALFWTTKLLRGETDQLEVGLDTGSVALQGVAFEARALGGSAWLRIRAEDGDGRWFAAPNALKITVGTPRIYDVAIDGLAPVDGGAPLVPSQLHRLVLEDVGLQDPNVLERTVILDDFTLY